MVYNIINSNSKGNAVIYHNEILVDLGVPFSRIRKYKNDLKLVLLTHEHKDHFNTKTIEILARERPTLLWGVPQHLKEQFDKIPMRIVKNNIIYLEPNRAYRLDDYIISPFNLYHDVDNVGYRIIKGNHKTIHATDTYTLEGIKAKDYDLYAIEHNYDEDTINDIIFEKLSNGQFAYEQKAIRNHLSFQQATAWINKNKKEDSEVIKLHMSTRYDFEKEGAKDESKIS